MDLKNDEFQCTCALKVSQFRLSKGLQKWIISGHLVLAHFLCQHETLDKSKSLVKQNPTLAIKKRELNP